MRIRWLGVLALGGSMALAQAPPVPAPAPGPASVEERLRALEEANRQLADQNRRLLERYQALERRLDGPPAADSAPADAPGGSSGQSPPKADAPEAKADAGSASLKASFGTPSGFQFQTEDEEFRLQVHNQTQAEYRAYEQGGQEPAGGGFYIPRERLIFSGRLTKPVEFEGSIEAAYGTINLLNAFLNLHYTDQLQFRFGRFKTPFGYEFLLANTTLLQPERSVFGNNFLPNRQVGAMLWGQVFGKKLDYYAGVFNGTRNNFVDFNEDKDVIAHLNYRPFFDESGCDHPLKFLALGGSVSAGNQDNPVLPRVLRTSVGASNNAALDNVAPAILAFRNDVLEHGDRTLWSAHAAYYRGGLSLYAEYQAGFTDYIRPGLDHRVNVPLDGFYVSGGYFLTGEQVEGRAVVKPVRNFDLRPQKFGLGAVELQARYSLLNIGREVFDAGLADPALWTDRVYAIDAGLNWYWNPYVKVYLDWQHSEFGQPVQFRPGGRQLTSDLFWVRFQVYF